MIRHKTPTIIGFVLAGAVAIAWIFGVFDKRKILHDSSVVVSEDMRLLETATFIKPKDEAEARALVDRFKEAVRVAAGRQHGEYVLSRTQIDGLAEISHDRLLLTLAPDYGRFQSHVRSLMLEKKPSEPSDAQADSSSRSHWEQVYNANTAPNHLAPLDVGKVSVRCLYMRGRATADFSLSRGHGLSVMDANGVFSKVREDPIGARATIYEVSVPFVAASNSDSGNTYNDDATPENPGRVRVYLRLAFVWRDDNKWAPWKITLDDVGNKANAFVQPRLF